MIRELIRTNRNFRRLWAGDIVSLFGDWFHTIALFTLAAELSPSPLAVGLVLVVRFLAWGLASPIAGVIVDRVDRRRLMIGADVLRAAIVPFFLLIRDDASLPWLYVLIALQIGIGSVFRPARAASLPNIVQPQELLAANTLMSATWSTLLAFGAALGGLAVHTLGTDAVFLIDAGSYLLSAFFIARTSFPSPRREHGEGTVVEAAWNDLRDGARTLVRQPEVGRIALAKATLALGGAGLVFLLTQIGEQVRPDATALGVGLLFAARGLGTGIGPFIARRSLPDRSAWPTWFGLFTLGSACCYAVASTMTHTLWVFVPVACAHLFSGSNWVLSTVLLQERAADEVRGRVFAAEWVALTGVNAMMVFIASSALDAEQITLPMLMRVLVGVMLVSGSLWLAFVAPAERRFSSRASREHR